MRLCIIGKYPPIQGGVSRDTFWLARLLAQSGHSVDVVTNALGVEPAFRQIFDQDDRKQLEWVSTSTSGGHVNLHPSAHIPAQSYIPWGRPWVSSLTSAALEVCKERPPDMIYAHYLEPYGVVALITSLITGIPFIIRHAGSDIGYLMQYPGMQSIYASVLRHAKWVVTSPHLARGMLSLGISPERLVYLPPIPIPPNLFSPSSPAFQFSNFVKSIHEQEHPYYEPYRELVKSAPSPDIPVIGMYGKLSHAKGWFELLKAFSILKMQGHRFVGFFLTQGRDKVMREFKNEITALDLSDRIYLFPFLPHWKVASFINACTVICDLENNFPISVHKSTIPTEVLSCGRCLIGTREVLNKLSYGSKLVDRVNVIIIDDPKSTSDLVGALKTVITEPENVKQIGIKGHEVLLSTFDFKQQERRVVQKIQELIFLRNGEEEAMALHDLHQALAMIYTNRLYRDEFFAGRNDLPGIERLSSEELQAIRLIGAGKTFELSEILKRKRWRRIQSLIPITGKFGEIRAAFDEFSEESPAQTTDATSEVKNFIRFLENRLSGDMNLPEYFSDVMRFEEIMSQARYMPIEIGKALSWIKRNQSTRNLHFAESDLPIRYPGIFIEQFEYNIDVIMQGLMRGSSDFVVEKTHPILLFQSSFQGLSASLHNISPDTAQLIRLCDGTNTVKSISKEFDSLDESNALNKVHSAIRDLLRLGILYMTPPDESKVMNQEVDSVVSDSEVESQNDKS